MGSPQQGSVVNVLGGGQSPAEPSGHCARRCRSPARGLKMILQAGLWATTARDAVFRI